MPAKSGVSGGIIAVIPGQIGIGVFSPRLDEHGHSVRGVSVCREFSETFGLHVFRNHTNSGTVIRGEMRGNVVRSKRVRTPEERHILDEKGAGVCLVELQGALFFGSTERLLRRLDALAADSEVLILDFRRVHDADQAARRLIAELDDWMTKRGRRLLFANVAADGPLATLHAMLIERRADAGEKLYPHRDAALEWCENRLIAASASARDLTKFSLAALDLFRGL